MKSGFYKLIRIPGRKLDVHAILSDHENPIVNPTVGIAGIYDIDIRV